MNRLAHFLIAVLICVGCALPQRLNVYLNTNDCFNCISAIDELPELSQNVFTRIICDETKKRFIPDLLAQHGISPSSNLVIDYVPPETLLRSAPTYATCELVLSDSARTSFYLRELAPHLPGILRTARSYDGTERLPLAVNKALGDRLTIFPLGERIMIVDYLFRRSYLATIDRKDSVQLSAFEPGLDLTRQAVSRLVGVGGLASIDSLNVLYSTSPEFSHAILAANEHGEGFEFADAIHYVGLFHDGSPINTSRSAYFNWANGVLSPALYGCWQVIDPYMIVLNFGFQLSETLLTTSVLRKETNDDPLYLLADWDKVADSIAFRSFRPLICPPSLQHYINGHSHVVSGLIRDGYYVTTAYPLIYSLKTDSALDLGQLLAPDEHDWFSNGQPYYTAWDVLPCGDEQVMILFNLGRKTELAWVDMNTRRILRRRSIPIDDVDVSTMRILSDGRLIAFSKSYDALIIRQ